MGLLFPPPRPCVTANCPINILSKFLSPEQGDLEGGRNWLSQKKNWSVRLSDLGCSEQNTEHALFNEFYRLHCSHSHICLCCLGGSMK